MRPTTEGRDVTAQGEHRLRVVGDRVTCRRIGATDVRRCSECLYLVRLGRRYVVCVDGEIPEEEPEFTW